MWFTALDVKTDVVNISGVAMDDKTVADFMVRLEGCGLFSSVSLRTVRQVEVQKTNLKSFEISCQKKIIKTTEGAGVRK
jgi:type IV pilus assembly protein PilN